MGAPVILFGALDRHNLGDLLFAHVAAALMPGREVIYAGLAARDMRGVGGHAVQALSSLLTLRGQQPSTLVHVGGEILTCDAWQAAVMLLPPDQAQGTIGYLESRPSEQPNWVRRMVGSHARAPYVASRRSYGGLSRVMFCGVGGVGLDRVDNGLRDEVLASLRSAEVITVRDHQTMAHLAAAGLAAQLIPDPVVMVAELFGGPIRQRANAGEVARVLQAFPQGYIAAQFSTDFGDDDTLGQLAAQLEQAAALAGMGVVLFRAGAAPWHDGLTTLGRLAALMRPGSAQVFSSLNVWDICALIAHSRAYCGSSLHGRIVAMAFALPRVNVRHQANKRGPSKQAAFAATWDTPKMPAEVDLGAMAAAVQTALAVKPESLRHTTQNLVGLYRRGFKAMDPGQGCATATQCDHNAAR